MSRAKMEETAIQKRAGRIAAVTAAVSVILLAGGFLIHFLLQDIMSGTAEAQIRMAASEYRGNILRLVKSDLQILQTLAGFLEEEEVSDKEELARKLYEANLENDFSGMAYFDADAGILVTPDGIEVGREYETLPEPMREALGRAGEGGPAVSDIYDSESMGEDIFVVCVPVTQDGRVRGVLAAGDLATRMRELFSEQFSLSDYSYVHLIGDDGVFRIRSEAGELPEETQFIFDNPHLSEETKERMRTVLTEGESGMFTLRIEGTGYKAFLQPVGLNGWYLFCVNSMKDVMGSVYWIIAGTQTVFLVILAFCIFLIVSGCRMLQSNNKMLLRAAYMDPLTGGRNLQGFVKKLEEACGQGREGSVAALNLHQFKFINEIFGREQADRLLKDIGEILKRELRAEEFFGRATADDFYLFLEGTDRQKTEIRLHGIMRKVKELPFLVRSSYHVLFYCGVAGTRGQEGKKDLASRLMTQVMFALDKAGEIRQDNVWFYDTQLHEKEKLENYVESHMHQALEKGEFRLYLQPKINLNDGSLAGAEALVRWVTEEGRTIFPNDFIPLFERNGFCARLDMYMTERVCRHIRSWMERGIEPVPVSVNQSRLLFFEADYPQRLQELVEESGIPAELITLEILEGLAVGNMKEMNERISQLQEEGFRVSMDDFGAGYSSLNVMGSLKIDELKLDRAFLMEISEENNLQQKAVMEMVVSLTKRLGIATVAEGVETKEDEALIREMGCDTGQGYYYSRPVSAAEFDAAFMKTASGGEAGRNRT